MAKTKKTTETTAAKKNPTTEAAAETQTKTVKTAKAVKEESPAVKIAETVKKAPAKKAPAKKTAPKKVAPVKTEAVAAKTAPSKEEKAAPAKVNFCVEFNGKQVSIDEVIENVKLTYGKDAKEISVYLKPQENKAYFVADGEEKEMDVFFC